MINIVYLVIFMVGGGGITSQTIPQANMQQCQANAKIYNTGVNNNTTANGYGSGAKTQAAHCVVGVAVR